MKSIKYILLIVLAIAILGVTWYAGFKYNFVNNKKETSVNIVLEKMEKVFKLVTVEGYLSEIYNHKDYYNWDISFFRKTALVRVNAKVLAGYDFEKAIFTIDEDSKTIRIDDFPEAEILSLEHDLDYYDISQGSFNTFSNDDYNEINKSVKEYARAKAIDSKLLKSAENQKDEIMDMLKTVIEATGWKVIINEEKDMFQN